MGEADFKQFTRLRTQLVNAAKSFDREENLTPVLKPTMSRDMDEQLKRDHKVVDVVDRANRKICVSLLRYSVDKRGSPYAQVQLIARRKENDKFQQLVYVIYKLREFIYLLVVMNYVYDKVITKKPICNVLREVFSSVSSLYHFFSIRFKMSWNIGDIRNLFLKLSSKFGFYHVVLKTLKSSPDKLTLTDCRRNTTIARHRKD